MKLNKILKEIRISNPNETFRFTPKGKDWFKKWGTFIELSDLFNMGDKLYETESHEIITMLNIDMLSDIRGEGVLSINGLNNINIAFEKYERVIGGEIGEFKNILKGFKDLGLITPIKL
jgi:hypothetical protein